MPVFGERAEKILKPATEITSIKVSRARYDNEITLPRQVRIDLDKKLIASKSSGNLLFTYIHTYITLFDNAG